MNAWIWDQIGLEPWGRAKQNKMHAEKQTIKTTANIWFRMKPAQMNTSASPVGKPNH